MLARQVALAGPRRFQNVDQKIILDLTTRTVTCGTAPAVRLTEREADLLTALAYAPDQTLTKQLILQDVWRYVPGLETHTLETHIYRLRQKIEADPKSPNVLITVENGYRLNVRVHP
jgi:DNA-binding response OmpR family regulator